MTNLIRFNTVGEANKYARQLYERKITSYVRQDNIGYYVSLV